MADNLSPNTARAPEQSNTEKKASRVSGLRQWLIDSYNGLFKIVIQPQLPSARLTGFMVLTFLLGMFWAYGISPVKFTDASPNQLSSSHRDFYVKLVAAAVRSNVFANPEADIPRLLGQVEAPRETVERLLKEETGTNWQPALQEVLDRGLAPTTGTPAPKGGGIFSDIITFVVAVVGLLVIMNITALLWGLLIGGYVERFWERVRPKSEADKERDAKAKKMREDIARRRELEHQMRAEVAEAAADLGPPLTQRISIYGKGRAYDDSFAIEDANDMFLGECGTTIAKTIGDSQELTAVEIWLFDKEDFVRTFTKLFVSQHAYNDPVIRAELEPKVEDPQADLVILEPGASIVLESKKIRMEAKVMDVTPGMTPGLPPNSHFEALTIQVHAWERAGAAPAPAMPPPIPAASGQRFLDEYEIGPPSAMPSGMSAPPRPPSAPPPMPRPPSTASGQRPLDEYEIGPPPPMPSGMSAPTQPSTPPPLRQPPPAPPGQRPSLPQQDDDPFDGAGDFTPIPRN